ncbi:MAG: hypothetical protein LLG02_15280 [Pelosinus sp.]|nr:hypothetical protein [Pelosinus sp.]
MELQIRQMIKRLLSLGYCKFEIKNIVKDAIGNDNIDNLSLAHTKQIVQHLAMYEELGLDYVNNYSK